MRYSTYNKLDEKPILDLFKASFKQKMPVSYWHWRFSRSPFGKSIITLAWDKNILVSHYALSIIKMNINGKMVRGALSGTTMTHPNYRGRGLFQKLARMAYNEARQLDVKIIIGFPNSSSHYGFINKLEWLNIFQVPTLTLGIEDHKRLAFEPELVGSTILDGHYFETIWNKFICQHSSFNTIVRDETYLTWRYFNHPTENYHIRTLKNISGSSGFVIFKHYESSYQIVDIVSLDNIGLTILLNDLIFEAVKNNITKIQCWFNINSSQHTVFEKFGFIMDAPITYFCAHLIDQQFIKASQLLYHNWYITMGDSDVY